MKKALLPSALFFTAITFVTVVSVSVCLPGLNMTVADAVVKGLISDDKAEVAFIRIAGHKEERLDGNQKTGVSSVSAVSHVSTVPIVSTGLIERFFSGHAAGRQDGPATDIFIAGIRLVDTSHQISNIRNLTQRDGYDNQPSFSRGGRYLIYTSMRDGQTDLFRHDFTSGETVRVTSTSESEYSPGWSPDNSGYSAVVVEEDGTQRLWFYSLDGRPVQPLLERVEPVGYYSWLDSTRVALFVLGDPPTLRIADISTGLVRTVAENIGRSLQTMPGSNRVAWLDKSDPQNWMIRVYDPDTREISSLITALSEAEDFAWTAYGTLIMARRSVIFEWDPLGTAGWTEIADLSSSGIRNITRLAVSSSGNRIAIVAGR